VSRNILKRQILATYAAVLEQVMIRVVNVFTPKNENHFLDRIVRR
jgi:hypothetical protein